MKLIVKDQGDLPAAARELLPVLPKRGVVALYGGMGAGKTTLVATLVREMGSTDEVTSPTFALVNEYVVPATGGSNGAGDEGDVGGADNGGNGGCSGNEGGAGGGHVFHFDFYRIDDPREAFDLGYEEYFYGGGLCLVEWPEKIEELLPGDTLRIRIDVGPDGSRVISVE